MKKVGLCIVASLYFICSATAQEGEGSAPNNELMVQTMNASGHATQYELVPIGAMHCWNSPYSYSVYSNPPTQALTLPGNVICAHVGFEVRTCAEGDYQVVYGCAAGANGVRALRYGFYKINIYVDNELRRYFYYDTRDCGLVNSSCGNCSGNDVTFRYDVTYDRLWWTNTFSVNPADPTPGTGWSTLSDGQVLKYGEIKSCSPRCFQPFWDNGLVLITKMGNESFRVPHLIWGPYSAFSATGYRIYWASTIGGPPTQFTLLAEVNSSTTEYTHHGIPVGGPYRAYYKVQAYSATQQSGFTNTVDIDYGNFQKPGNDDVQRHAIVKSPTVVYPNPSNPSVTIQFRLWEDGHVSLRMFDVLGREVAKLIDGFRKAGDINVVFAADRLPGGAYYYVLRSDENIHTGTMLLAH
jgi:hypothetical protein